jgi:hypothetical protein
VCDDRGSPSVPGVSMRPLASTRLRPRMCSDYCAGRVEVYGDWGYRRCLHHVRWHKRGVDNKMTVISTLSAIPIVNSRFAFMRIISTKI